MSSEASAKEGRINRLPWASDGTAIFSLVEMKESNQPSVEGKSVGASPITSANFVEVSPSSHGSWLTSSHSGGASPSTSTIFIPE